MEEKSLAFMSSHPSDGALTSVGGGGGVAVMLPTLPLHELRRDSTAISSSALNLSTYTAGEDAGRLAMLAKEFGLARVRSQKRQLRKHTFKVRVHLDTKLFCTSKYLMKHFICSIQ